VFYFAAEQVERQQAKGKGEGCGEAVFQVYYLLL
jgi:hypothetical protein